MILDVKFILLMMINLFGLVEVKKAKIVYLRMN